MTKDEHREEMIRAKGEQFLMCSDKAKAREIWQDIRVLIKGRSTAQVERMEIEKGLR